MNTQRLPLIILMVVQTTALSSFHTMETHMHARPACTVQPRDGLRNRAVKLRLCSEFFSALWGTSHTVTALLCSDETQTCGRVDKQVKKKKKKVYIYILCVYINIKYFSMSLRYIRQSQRPTKSVCFVTSYKSV